MNSYNYSLSFYFPDYSQQILCYDQFCVLHNNDIVVPTTLINNKAMNVTFGTDESFNNQCSIILSSSVEKQKRSIPYEITVYYKKTITIVAFINREYNHQIDFYYQVHTKITQRVISLKIDLLKIDIDMNYLDQIRKKSVFYLINIPLSIEIISPIINYQINENKDHLKFCLHFLKEKEKYYYYLSIHSFSNDNERESTIEKVKNDKQFFMNIANEINKEINELIEKKEKNEYTAKEHFDYFNSLAELLIEKKENYPELFMLDSIPLNLLPLSEELFPILNNAYYISYIYTLTFKTLYLNKEDKNFLFDIEDNFEALLITTNYKNRFETLLNNDSLSLKFKKLSVYYACLSNGHAGKDQPIIPHIFYYNETNNFYKEAFILLRKTIEELNDDSYLIEPLMMLNSHASKDLNVKSETFNSNIFEICILDVNEIKTELLKHIPSFIFRWESLYSNLRAFFDGRSREIVINEQLLLDNNILSINRYMKCGYDKTYQCTIPVFAELLHEYCGHFKKRIENPIEKTPEKYIYNGELRSNTEIGEAGRIIERYIGSQNQVEYLKKRNTEFASFYDSRLFSSKSNSDLINKIKKIQTKESKTSIKKKEEKEKGCIVSDFATNYIKEYKEPFRCMNEYNNEENYKKIKQILMKNKEKKLNNIL